MLDREKRVQGYATYFEFAKPNGTIQLVLFPDAYSSSGHMTPAHAYWRQVDTWKPKRQWKRHRLATTVQDLVSDETQLLILANEKLLSLTFLLKPVFASGYQLVGKPLVVEISSKDIDDINERKTPTKVIHRVQQSRIASGFPADLVKSVQGENENGLIKRLVSCIER